MSKAGCRLKTLPNHRAPSALAGFRGGLWDVGARLVDFGIKRYPTGTKSRSLAHLLPSLRQ